MKVLVLGSGGREHALIWKISQSSKVNKIYCVPGNGGIKELAEIPILNPNDNIEVLSFVKENNIDLTIVGPEAYLVNGIVDILEDAGYKVFGPRKNASIFEESKIFTKEFLIKYNIPTGDYAKFNSSQSALQYLESYSNFPVVIKADGLAGGKGVIICKTKLDAQNAVKDIMVSHKFGKAGQNIIIEEFLIGNEISILTFVDGKTMIPMVLAKDYKKIGNGETGLNTGGMGCISPNPNVTVDMETVCQNEILDPIMNGLISEKMDFRGVLFIGIIYTKKGPKVLEFNVRFGDPETQVILPRLKNDITDVFLAVINRDLKNIKLNWYENSVCTIVLASDGYPENYKKGNEINGLNNCKSIVFHAGTKSENDKIFTNGGRVLNITAEGDNHKEAIKNAYSVIENIHFEGMYFRNDIGK
ncbi:MAG: phosphoribosylamine--glycine ligase [Candidatus Marinimicrobia bacterium]|nr:phosphoribosylamine--glycine ligase [Candidatus Neomarinimicrobiota bacterium]